MPLQEVKAQLPSVQALGHELPEIVATLHSDMRQVVRDLESLAKVHSAAADVAPVCSQVRFRKGPSDRPVRSMHAFRCVSTTRECCNSFVLQCHLHSNLVPHVAMIIWLRALPADDSVTCSSARSGSNSDHGWKVLQLASAVWPRTQPAPPVLAVPLVQRTRLRR